MENTDILAFALSTTQENLPVIDLKKRMGNMRNNLESLGSGVGLQNESLDNIVALVSQEDITEEKIEHAFDLTVNILDEIKEFENIDGAGIIVKDRLVTLVAALSNISFHSANYYKKQCELFQTQKQELIEKKNQFFAEIQENKSLYAEYLKKEKALENVNQQIKKEIDEYLKMALKASAELSEIKRKKKKALTWCWVPGYNIYLWVDEEKAASHKKSYEQKLKSAKKEQKKLLDEQKKLLKELKNVKGQGNKIQDEIEDNEEAMNQCNEKIDFAKSKSLQTSDYALFFSTTYKKLEYVDARSAYLFELVGEIENAVMVRKNVI